VGLEGEKKPSFNLGVILWFIKKKEGGGGKSFPFMAEKKVG